MLGGNQDEGRLMCMPVQDVRPVGMGMVHLIMGMFMNMFFYGFRMFVKVMQIVVPMKMIMLDRRVPVNMGMFFADQQPGTECHEQKSRYH